MISRSFLILLRGFLNGISNKRCEFSYASRKRSEAPVGHLSSKRFTLGQQGQSVDVDREIYQKSLCDFAGSAGGYLYI